jgi:hypothetical protein
VCITLGGDMYDGFVRKSPKWIERADGIKHNGHDGVTLAHLAVYRRAMADGIQLLTVFEDDARLFRQPTPLDVGVIARFRRSPHSTLLMLGYQPAVHSMRPRSRSRATGHGMDFHAYMVTAAGMRQILALFPSPARYHRPLAMGSIDTFSMVRVVDGLHTPLFAQYGNSAYVTLQSRLQPSWQREMAADLQYMVTRVANLIFFVCYRWSVLRFGLSVVSVAWLYVGVRAVRHRVCNQCAGQNCTKKNIVLSQTCLPQ